MKIFNWMHKRFHHHSNLKDGFASSNIKKTEPTNNKVDSQALLKQVALTDMLGGWNDGILTIGTLGYDPLKGINHKKEYFSMELAEYEQVKSEGDQHVLVDDETCYNAEQEELNPLMCNTFEHNFEDDEIQFDARKEEKVSRTINEIVEVEPEVISNEIIESSLDLEADNQKKKGAGERITLADLFLADSDVNLKLDYPAKVLFESTTEKPNLKAKHGLSFAKKIIPMVKDNAHPMKDIKKLMKRMLKRKIHPDLEIKNHKAEGEEGIIIDNNMNEGSDSSYFLPI